MKIIDKIRSFKAENKPFYSFEFFPPKTEAGLQNLYDRLDRMAALEPAFIDITWGAGGTTSAKSLELSKNAQTYFGVDVMMHLTCTNIDREALRKVLHDAKDAGLKNILALRGDPPDGCASWESAENGFQYASDLTKFIRAEFNDHFSLAVGGYPEGHAEAESRDQCLEFLKAKVDAGADFVITQLFYDLDEYLSFVARCREIGIECPIIPGIMPISNYQRFKKFTDFCQIKVPQSMQRDLEEIKNDDAAVQEYGVNLAVEMCRKLLETGSPGLHFYTLNLESSVTQVLGRLGFAEKCRHRRALPWRRSTLEPRQNEDVRPIYWSNRPKSYLARTMRWDDFPNGRWGDSRSPTFGELDDYHLLRGALGLQARKEMLREMWGEPKSLEDVAGVFVAFCQGKIDRLPWCEMPVQAETSRISEQLVNLNRAGFLTINSQPQVNAAPSSDPEIGWGGEGGYIYQKAYLEFFVPKEKFAHLKERFSAFPSLTYQAVTNESAVDSNLPLDAVTAVTWGVFPGREILQPTVVDPESFVIWRDEAFMLWRQAWQALYENSSISYELIGSIYKTHYLVNIVENDFVNGDIFKVFSDLS